MRELYAYADETYFKKDEGSNVIGAGILIVEQKISQSVVSDALEALNSDPELDYRDKVTLSKKIFHASYDSKNAHSHFCRSIKNNIRGNFRYSYYEPSKQESWEKKKSLEEVLRLTLGLSTLQFFSDELLKVNLFVEGREALTQRSVEIWKESWYNQLDLQCYEYPSFITCYPSLSISVVDKSEPGIQVVDFILWSLNRANMKQPDKRWMDRLNLRMSSTFSEQGGPQSGGEYILKERIREHPLFQYPVKVEDPASDDELQKCYFLIEKTIKHLRNEGIPVRLQHLENKIIQTADKLEKSKIDLTDLKEVASCFIRVFDSLPLYEDFTKDSILWPLYLKAKKMAGLVLRSDLIHGMRTANYFITLRNRNYDSFPQYFNP